VVDTPGGPLRAPLAGATMHDTKRLAATLEASVVARPQPPAERPPLSVGTKAMIIRRGLRLWRQIKTSP
jgi:hypothetical protein